MLFDENGHQLPSISSRSHWDNFKKLKAADSQTFHKICDYVSRRIARVRSRPPRFASSSVASALIKSVPVELKDRVGPYLSNDIGLNHLFGMFIWHVLAECKNEEWELSTEERMTDYAAKIYTRTFPS